jgi:hypothetical protein
VKSPRGTASDSKIANTRVFFMGTPRLLRRIIGRTGA